MNNETRAIVITWEIEFRHIENYCFTEEHLEFHGLRFFEMEIGET